MGIPDFNDILTAFDKVSPIVSRWLGPEKVEDLEANLKLKAQSDRPRIMVYGVYNAGKSTLLNALMGAEKASMADRPETAEVKGYDWKGYSLLDTPGIDAPIEHEKVTEESLNQSDVVLFVVAAGGTAAENATWEAMMEIVARNRRVMLVINDKLGLDPEGTDYLTVVNSAREHMQMAAEKAGLENVLEHVPVCVINARTALKGRVEGKNLLIRRSGLEQLENRLYAFLETCDFATVCRSAAKDVQDIIDAASTALEKQAGTVESRKVEELEQGARKGKERIRTSATSTIDTVVLEKQKRVVAFCRAKADNPDYPYSEIEEVTEQMNGKILTFLVRETEEVFRELNHNYMPSESYTKKDTQSGRIEMDIKHDATPSVLAQELAEMSRSLGQQILTISAQDMSGVAENVLTFGKGLSKTSDSTILKSLFKGVGKKKIAVAAEKIGKAVGPAIAIGSALYSAGRAIQQDYAQRREKERRMVAIQDAADGYLSSFKDAAMEMVGEYISETFSDLDDHLKNSKAEILNQNQSLAEDRTILSCGQIELQRLCP
ncbi:50S ribosome-binding GTPase [Acetobacter suratthaniensis]|uniref:50S ribosome-binding GTPase n=1 Tax=Acetobacter suratthaniensis TaxID=1502841 RepID=A0ABS3LQE2_9PROT|nr:GTPase [Acetobacter suratthaniensis]MBO1329592.1 50S ribosome-binding GTPase [Acetobacter suratthaniensis]MCX2567606.1 50S ribosome-binding GTPase [Acetobacter suratthaniensis]